LDSELAKQDFLSNYQLAWRGEMILLEGGACDYLRHHPEQLGNIADDSSSGPVLPSGFIAALIPSGWFYQNQLSCARIVEEFCLPLVDENRGVVSAPQVKRNEEAVRSETRHANPYNVSASFLLSALSGPVQKCAYAQNVVNMARVAAALERYRLAHGVFPDSLNVLSPQFIQQVPHDVINGEPCNMSARGISSLSFIPLVGMKRMMEAL
jgi:hypothetical protein